MTTDRFWKWFEDNSARLYGCGSAIVADELEALVSQIDDRLGVEVASDHGKKDVIFTVSGDPDAFSVVRELVAAAPLVKGWKFVCLKPPRGCDFRLQVDGFDVHADRCMFDPLMSEDHPNALGLRLFIPPIDEPSPDLDYLAALIIETTIGEELAASIGYVDVAPWRERGDALPISDMHKYVEWFFNRKPAEER